MRRIRFHRASLVAGTVGLSIAGSRIATEGVELGSWILLAGSGLIVVLADMFREIEDNARALASTAGARVGSARRDLLATRRPRLLASLTLLSVVAVGFACFAFAIASQSEGGSRAPTPATEGP